ncbi:MAG TPA: ATP-grasp domain-containing protein, partial [Methylotenera sp.]|nr:ATP-grasp domain-containing protein [Methylotenera sp.]
MADTLIIAAASARGYAQAAVTCGYEVIALDAFSDAETKAISKQAFKLKMDGFALDKEYFKQVFLEIDLSNIEGFLYGSLFDSCPEVLDWVAKQLSVWGNSADVLKQAKDFSFFALLDSLNIPHPKVQTSFPDKLGHWLTKKVGGSGGMHIRPADLTYGDKTYFQQKITGTPISLLFVADGSKAHLIGFNQQLLAPTESLPYRFAGAISNVTLQSNIHKEFEYAAQKLTNTLDLRGICSIDAIVGKDNGEGKNVWLLELNPRLSATFHLYENLLPLHLQGCAGHLPNNPVKPNISRAQLILYAEE